MLKDKDVYEFINSGDCYDFYALRTYLIDNNTPLYERYSYYFLGKHDYFNQEYLDGFLIHRPSGSPQLKYPFFEMYHWEPYLYYSEEIKQSMKAELTESGLSIPLDFEEYYVRTAWERVTEKSEESLDWYNNAVELYYNERGYNEPLDDDDLFCESCQSSPCMCSDPDQSSYIRPPGD